MFPGPTVRGVARRSKTECAHPGLPKPLVLGFPGIHDRVDPIAHGVLCLFMFEY